MERNTKKLNEFKKGDIIYMGIPFEENTRDYYNGYDPKKIRGHEYTNRLGQAQKARYVIVIGRDENNIQYLPLTSRHKGFDEQHHYVLQDNSMTYRKDPDMKSYVEMDSLRSVYVNPKWDIQYTGRIAENDMANIMIRLSKNKIDFESKRDQRAYVSRGKEEKFEKILIEKGYELKKEDFSEKIYKNDNGRTVTKTKWGLVKYHVPLSKKEVTEMVARREGVSPESFGKEKEESDDEFAKAVSEVTEKMTENEREVI